MSIFNRGSRPDDEEKTMPMYDIPQPVSPDSPTVGTTQGTDFGGYANFSNFNGFDDDKTMPMTGIGFDPDVTQPVTQKDEEKTIGIYSNVFTQPLTGFNSHSEPAVGWLVCTGGSCLGQDFRVYPGRNSLGRGEGNSIRLEDTSVSRETQALLVFDPRSNRFFAAPGSSTGLCYLNGGMVLSQTELKKNDVLELGKCKLMLIPCCDEHFSWSQVLGK